MQDNTQNSSLGQQRRQQANRNDHNGRAETNYRKMWKLRIYKVTHKMGGEKKPPLTS